MKRNNKIKKYKELDKPLSEKVPDAKEIENNGCTDSLYKTISLRFKKLSSLQQRTKKLSKKNEEHYRSLF